MRFYCLIAQPKSVGDELLQIFIDRTLKEQAIRGGLFQISWAWSVKE